MSTKSKLERGTNVWNKCVLLVCALISLAGCDSGSPPVPNLGKTKEQVLLDPAYTAKRGDTAELWRSTIPGKSVPYVLDKEVYARIYDSIIRDGEVFVSDADQAEIRWVAPGSKVKVLWVEDQKSIEILKRSGANSVDTLRPYAKIILLDPQGNEKINNHYIGWTLIEYVAQPMR